MFSGPLCTDAAPGRANRCLLQKEQKETDRMGVCTEWEQGWCIVWSATWLPLGLDCFPRGLGSGEGRRGEGGVSAEAELSRACWPLKRHVDRGWDVTRGFQSPWVQGRGSKKRDDENTGETEGIKIHQHPTPTPRQCGVDILWEKDTSPASKSRP